MEWAYLVSLVLVIACLVLVDWRFKLAFFYRAGRTAQTLAIAVWLFITWDILGIALDIFSHGDSIYALPYRIVPEFPIEELFFLFLLTYVALLLYRFFSKRSEVKKK